MTYLKMLIQLFITSSMINKNPVPIAMLILTKEKTTVSNAKPTSTMAILILPVGAVKESGYLILPKGKAIAQNAIAATTNGGYILPGVIALAIQNNTTPASNEPTTVMAVHFSETSMAYFPSL